MRARLREPGESLRWFFYGLAAICIGAAITFRAELGPPLDPVFFMGAALVFVAPFFHRRAGLREVEVDVRAGSVRLSSPVDSKKKEVTEIAVRRLTGASTARVGDRFTLALTIGSKKRPPITLTFDREQDVNDVMKALGIGRAGFGILSWDRGPRAIHRLAAAIRLLAGLACVLICVLAKLVDSFAANLDTMSLVTLVVVAHAAFVTLVPFVFAKRTISLLPDGVHTFEERVRSYKYADIAAIRSKMSPIRFAWEETGPRSFEIDFIRRGPGKNEQRVEVVRIPYFDASPSFLSLGGLDDTDVAILLHQIEAAAARARDPRAQSEHVENVRQLLERRKDESGETWIRRLDTLADSWRHSPPRHGEASSVRHGLWQAVEDHDSEDHIRMLAARMLARLDPEAAPPKLRVIAEAIRDPRRASELRSALEEDATPMLKSLSGGRRA